jgi:hypothetical protein
MTCVLWSALVECVTRQDLMTRLREISDVTDDEAAVNIDALCAHVPGMRVPRLVNALSPDCAIRARVA